MHKKENWVQKLWRQLIYKINALTFEGFYFDISLKRNQIIRIRFWQDLRYYYFKTQKKAAFDLGMERSLKGFYYTVLLKVFIMYLTMLPLTTNKMITYLFTTIQEVT